jgi:hypothetical protein
MSRARPVATLAGFFCARRLPPIRKHTLKPIQTAAELRLAIARPVAPRACSCALGNCAGWESLAEYRWEAQQMTRIATLRDPALEEPTYEERHPRGTRYDAPDAPVAVPFFRTTAARSGTAPAVTGTCCAIPSSAATTWTTGSGCSIPATSSTEPVAMLSIAACDRPIRASDLKSS